MAQPYIGEIRMFAGNFAPSGWMMCEGQLISISEYETLFNLIGTTYGGDGQSTFALPDLRGRLPIHQGGGYVLAETGGAEQVTLTVNQIPNHQHALIGSTNNATSNTPANQVVGALTSFDLYRPAAIPNTAMAAASVGSAGGSQPHSNMQPYLCVNFIISLFGIYPSPT
jgi:microcystin-dependent protein